MKARYYEKVYHDMLNDHKLGPLNDALKWRFVSLILAAGQHDRGGTLPDLPDLAWELRVSEEQLKTELPALAGRGLVEIVRTEEGDRWHVTNYAKRQAAVTAVERKRRSRSAASAATTEEWEEEDREDIEEVIVDIVTVNVTTRDKNVTAELLKDSGIARNKTTAPLWKLEPAYVEAHLSAAKTAGLAIRRMLDGDPAPRPKVDPSVWDVIRR